MKKITILLISIIIIFLMFFTIQSNAAEVVNISLSTNKEIVHPGDTIELTIDFDKTLGAYTFDVLYDDILLDFESVSEGTSEVLEDGVRITFASYLTPSDRISLIFKAKTGRTESSKTNFAVTGTGLADPDEVLYEDITEPENIDFTVEPAYVNYTIGLDYTGAILPDEEKEMKVETHSPIGRYHDHVRLLAEITGPEGSVSKLIGIDDDENNTEYDVFTDGWGDSAGYSIGGEDFTQEFTFMGTFSEKGEYTLTFKLYDLDNDRVIAENSYRLAVGVSEVIPEPEQQEEQQEQDNKQEEVKKEEEKLPAKLPKTGYNSIILISVFIILSIAGYVYYIKE